MASRKGSLAEAMAAAAAEQPRDVADFFDPVQEWLDDGANYLLRLNLPGFKKENFRVLVEPAGRLTIRGQGLADGGSVRLHKVFQLPPTSDLDGITARFDGGVFTLTVPKLPPGAVAPPQAPEEEEDVSDKPTDQKAKVGREAERRIEAARAALAARRHRGEEEKQTGRSKKPPAKKVDEVGERPKAVATATPSDMAAKREDEDDKAKAEHKAKVGGEAERWIEATRERLPDAEWEREKGRWKERAAEEGFKWADAIGKKKEVIAMAVAAFTLGVFVSHKLFSRN